MKEYLITPADEGQTLLKYLEKVLPGAGGGVFFKALRKKNIVINGARATGREKLKNGDSVRVFFSDEVIEKFSPRRSKAESGPKIKNTDEKQFKKAVIFEDDNILIVNKWDNILSQPDGGTEPSLNDLLTHYLKDIVKVYAVKPSVCNRLDRNTTGLVLCGKTQKGLKLLSDVLKDRSLKKYYYAVCLGEINNSLSLKGYLYKDSKENRAVITDSSENKDASPVQTDVEPVSRLKIKDSIFTLVKVHLITGKPHQIRAHMLKAGHPVMGDIKYHTEESLRLSKELDIKRQMLHAYKVEFPKIKGDLSYLSGKVFEAPVPNDMNRLLSHRK
ncbi:MAG: RluA family pseudouridine synthase [Lachnospiraceae bacterium]|nr:RluA family pseudouridine synthase [Lachnospiraceae bacterium]